MTNEQNIRIAEACGFKPVTGFEGKFWIHEKRGLLAPREFDHTNSLDAIRAAVMEQGEEFQMRFAKVMWAMCKTQHKHPHQLTPSDWCACFLKVLDEMKARDK